MDRQQYLIDRSTGPVEQIGPSYRDDEVCYPDHFVTRYVGKVYSDPSVTEVVSVGLAHLSQGSGIVKLAKADPEHLYLIVGILKQEYNHETIRKIAEEERNG